MTFIFCSDTQLASVVEDTGGGQISKDGNNIF